MKINKNVLIRTTFAASICLTFIGFILHFNHSNSADIILIIGLTATLAFMGLVLYEIFTSTHLKPSEKIMWTIGIILLSSIGGFLFLLSLRNNWKDE